MVNFLQPQSRLVYLCGFSGTTETDFCRHFSESLAEWELQVYGLEDGLKIAIHTNPAYLFVLIENSNHLSIILSDIAFLRRQFPFVNRILVCSNELYSERIVDEISFDGFLKPDCGGDELKECVFKIGQGLRYVHPDIRRTYVDTPHLPSKVTEHERKVLRLVSQGKQNKQIAEELCISPHTVKNHKSKLMHKLNLAGTIDLYQYAVRFTQEFSLSMDTAWSIGIISYAILAYFLFDALR